MISLSFGDARPIYEQIKDGLRHLMVIGALEPGEKLPSVRSLASDLSINPNTIQRAYEALEAEGYLCTQPGRGSFAAAQTDVNRARRTELFAQFDVTATELLYLGSTPGELSDRIVGMTQ